MIQKLVLFLILAACQVGPKYHRPSTAAPEKWKHEAPAAETFEYTDNWWEIFHEPLLDDYEQQAVQNNPTLLGALERVQQARALIGIAVADLYPQLNLDPSYLNQGILEKLPGVSSSKKKPVSPFLRVHQFQYELPLNLSYELDLWGRLRSQYFATLYSYEAQIEDYNSALLILTADVASTYYQIRALDTLLELFSDTIKTRQKALDINQSRYDYKVVNYLDVAQADLELQNVRSQYFDTKRLRDLQEDRLATLLGIPASTFCIEFNPLRALPPSIPEGIPSDVLVQRPDIAAAERTMAAENARVGVAYASFFPSVQLTASLGYLSPDLKHFLKWISRFWALGANIDQTVFDGGRKCYNLELAWSRFREANDDYKATVINAFQEVEDALANLEWLAKEGESVQLAVGAAKKAYRISMDRYLAGVAFYLDVVDSERQELDNERALIGILEQRYLATVQFIKALGGSSYRKGACFLE